MFLYIKTNILRGYGIFENDFAHSHEPANSPLHQSVETRNCLLPLAILQLPAHVRWPPVHQRWLPLNMKETYIQDEKANVPPKLR